MAEQKASPVAERLSKLLQHLGAADQAAINILVCAASDAMTRAEELRAQVKRLEGQVSDLAAKLRDHEVERERWALRDEVMP